jgi:hypothetical protein
MKKKVHIIVMGLSLFASVPRTHSGVAELALRTFKASGIQASVNKTKESFENIKLNKDGKEIDWWDKRFCTKCGRKLIDGKCPECDDDEIL